MGAQEGRRCLQQAFAWKGTFAVAGEQDDGLIVSDKFPTYRANADALDLDYLRYYFKCSRLWRQARALSKGAAALSKLTLNPPDFFRLTIPLPKCKVEQHRIASRLEAAFGVVKSLELAHRRAVLHLSSVLRALVDERTKDLEVTGCLGDILLEKPRNGWSPYCDNVDDGAAVLTLSAITGFEYRADEFKRTSLPVNENAHYWLAPGDLLLTRSNTLELVGHAAIYDGEPTPCIYPDLMMRLRINEALASKEFVHWWLRGGMARRFIMSNAAGTSPTMKKINSRIVQAIPFPTGLDLGVQKRLFRHFEEVKLITARARRLELSTTSSAAALLPALVERAFSGQL